MSETQMVDRKAGLIEPPGDWEIKPRTVATETRVLKSYVRALSDSHSMDDIVRTMREGLLIEHPRCWVLVSDAVEGASLRIHGGKWSGCEGQVDEEFKEILGWLFEQGRVEVINALIPDFCKGAIELCKRAGFYDVGFIPFDGTENGEPYSTKIFSLKRE